MEGKTTEDPEADEDMVTYKEAASAKAAAKAAAKAVAKGKEVAVEAEVEVQDEEEQQGPLLLGWQNVDTPALDIGDVVCLMACGADWDVEPEEKRWEASHGSKGFVETVWYSEKKPHHPLPHTPLLTAVVLDNRKGAKVQHLGMDVKEGLPEGWVALKVRSRYLRTKLVCF